MLFTLPFAHVILGHLRNSFEHFVLVETVDAPVKWITYRVVQVHPMVNELGWEAVHGNTFNSIEEGQAGLIRRARWFM
jgi:hypothetical protein